MKVYRKSNNYLVFQATTSLKVTSHEIWHVARTKFNKTCSQTACCGPYCRRRLFILAYVMLSTGRSSCSWPSARQCSQTSWTRQWLNRIQSNEQSYTAVVLHSGVEEGRTPLTKCLTSLYLVELVTRHHVL